MSGVYGDFIENFPELYELFEYWYKPGEEHHFCKAVYMPTKGDGIKRRKYTSGNTALDMTETDEFYINHIYDDKVKVGAFIRKVNDNIIMRLTHNVPYDKAAGYRVYTIERVTGANEEQQQELPVKEAYFA